MVEVVVIGDSHGRSFWSGHNHIDGPDTIPGWKTIFTGGYTAFSLTIENHESRKRWLLNFNKTIQENFQGWIMISHGEVDARFRLEEQSLEKGLHEAIDFCVEKYFQFILEIYRQYPKISIWGTPATAKPGTHRAGGTEENEIQRNIISYLFNKKLLLKLVDYPIPFFSVFPLMINDDGTTKKEATFDSLHASQSLRSLIQPTVEKYLEIYSSLENNSIDLQNQCYDSSKVDKIFEKLLDKL